MLLLPPGHPHTLAKAWPCVCNCCQQIVSAKVPILKANLQVFVSPGQLLAALGQDSKAAAQQLRTALGGNSLNSKPDKKLRVDMEVDVSLGIADSAAAVNFLQRQVGAGTACHAMPGGAGLGLAAQVLKLCPGLCFLGPWLGCQTQLVHVVG